MSTDRSINPKLSIELVPRPCWEQNVRSEVTSVEWDVIRNLVYTRAKGRCEICASKTKKLHAHETWEYNEITKVQKLVGFVAICVRCHEVKHYGRSEVVGRGAEAYRWLTKINNWSVEEARRYINVMFLDWELRNEIKKWKLDIHYLKEFMESL